MSTPKVHEQTPRLAHAAGCTLGEGALWDHRTGHLLFVDVKDPALWRFHPDGGEAHRLALDEPIGFVALTPDTDIVIAGFKSGLARLHLFGGEREPLASPEPDKPGNRINDGHVGPDGSLYFGTMDDGEREPTGAFWRYGGQALTSFHEGHVVTNGPAVSADGRTLYTVASKERLVFAHPLVGGAPGEPRPLVQFEEGWGHPDGLAVDAEEHLWICAWGGSRVLRFSPDGALERVVPVPTAQVTKCAFGGAGLETLFITTAAIGRDPSIDPMAGHLFAVEAGVEGLRARIFGGERS